MRVHQVFTDTPGELKYRDLSCFCQRGFCLCLDPKTYLPVPTPVVGKISNSIEKSYADGLKNKELLADISNVHTESRRSYYSMVYSPSSGSDEEVLANLDQPSVSNVKEKQLIDKENVYPSKISDGVYVLVKVSSVKDKHYTYLGVAKSTVDEEGDVKVMFY
ncbi:unnamed protein product [Acanthoscelides obtectus]|uniref:Uncharacterized protein n=1 Tax=Acanthoscelides obtectus TaxID=200917 RepID=A0A9P0LR04_ACAOB|nr:unnamed protein product [Acanthoscelides obtectus]CAK1670088.1 hypothetical protein AOBTE_LOCUS27388 [Acanthoscelides obtectus]